jgi:hypothetical protein
LTWKWNHGPFGKNLFNYPERADGIRIGLAGVAVAAQVGQHHRVIVGQSRGDVPPGEVILRVAVQHQHRRTGAPDGTADRHALDIDAPVLEAGKQSARGGHL